MAGSKSSSFVDCAVYSGSFTKALGLYSAASSFIAGLYDILLGVEHILDNNIKKAILFVN